MEGGEGEGSEGGGGDHDRGGRTLYLAQTRTAVVVRPDHTRHHPLHPGGRAEECSVGSRHEGRRDELQPRREKWATQRR